VAVQQQRQGNRLTRQRGLFRGLPLKVLLLSVLCVLAAVEVVAYMLLVATAAALVGKTTLLLQQDNHIPS
jgi:hypothetical protein